MRKNNNLDICTVKFDRIRSERYQFIFHERPQYVHGDLLLISTINLRLIVDPFSFFKHNAALAQEKQSQKFFLFKNHHKKSSQNFKSLY